MVDTIDCISVASDLCGRLKRRRLDGRLRLLSSGQRRAQTGVRLRLPWPRPPLVASALMTFWHVATVSTQSRPRKDIWTLVHQTPTQFRRWQREDQEATDTDRKNFERILAMTPHEFIETVTKRRNRTR